MKFSVTYDPRKVDKGFHTKIENVLKEVGYTWSSTEPDLYRNLTAKFFETTLPVLKIKTCTECHRDMT